MTLSRLQCLEARTRVPGRSLEVRPTRTHARWRFRCASYIRLEYCTFRRLLKNPNRSLPATAQVEPSSQGALDEVVITAEKRDSAVQSTPVSMTAISGAGLEGRDLANVLAVAGQTPGVSFPTARPGRAEVDMRGVSSTGGSVRTAGFNLDETPIAPLSFGATGKAVIDPNLYDLHSVARCPPGPLYGAGSMGGTIRILTNQPDLSVHLMRHLTPATLRNGWRVR